MLGTQNNSGGRDPERGRGGESAGVILSVLREASLAEAPKGESTKKSLWLETAAQ
jgi:hypothetical protein